MSSQAFFWALIVYPKSGASTDAARRGRMIDSGALKSRRVTSAAAGGAETGRPRVVHRARSAASSSANEAVTWSPRTLALTPLPPSEPSHFETSSTASLVPPASERSSSAVLWRA